MRVVALLFAGLTGLPSTHSKYHSCDVAAYNAFKQSLQRHLTHQRFLPTGMSSVPNQKTVFCPETVENLKYNDVSPDGSYTTGFDTVWIVENTASVPIVISYVNKKNGLEYSAVNGKITPPHKDPQAILQPQAWKAIYTWEGDIFHARELIQDAANPEGMLGDVLMQHRTGLVPIGTHAQELICPSTDPEPLVNSTRDPDFARTPPPDVRPCNTIDLGFRNMANCPLDVYYVKTTEENGLQEEQFKFHLGLNPQAEDFMWGWDSQTKFEGSFVSHSFAFRLAADPTVLVQTVTLEPTRVVDCPNLKNKVQVNRGSGVGVGETILLPNGLQDDVTEKDTVLTYNVTSWNRINGTVAPVSRSRRYNLLATRTAGMVSH